MVEKPEAVLFGIAGSLPRTGLLEENLQGQGSLPLVLPGSPFIAMCFGKGTWHAATASLCRIAGSLPRTRLLEENLQGQNSSKRMGTKPVAISFT